MIHLVPTDLLQIVLLKSNYRAILQRFGLSVHLEVNEWRANIMNQTWYDGDYWIIIITYE